MTTITISSGTTTVSTTIPTTTAYILEGFSTLDVVSGGVISGLITINSFGTVNVSSGGAVLATVQ